jgi:hypothetical protein
MMRYALESLALAAIGAWSIWDGVRLSTDVRREGVFDALGPDRYIMILGGILLVLSVARIWTARAEWLAEHGPSGSSAAAPDNAPPLKFILLTVAFAGYALIAPYTGYGLATVLFFAAVYWIMGLRGWLRLIAATAISAATFILLFITLADMPLPRGILGLPF